MDLAKSTCSVTAVPAGTAPDGIPLTDRSFPCTASNVSGKVGVPVTENPWTKTS